MLSRYEHGRIIAVNEVRFGSNLVADHAAGVTSLTVEDAADFDETGGQLTINGQVIDYTTFDDDTGTITLSAPLAAAGEDGDRVDVYDPLYGSASTEKVAQVQLDGDDDTNTDPLEATVALHLSESLDDGLRGVTGESVLLERDGEEWRVIDVLGRSQVQNSGGTLFTVDAFTLGSTADQVLNLSQVPINGSEHVYWNGIYQQAALAWTRNGQALSIVGANSKVGDVIAVRYAYTQGIASPVAYEPPPPPGPSYTILATGTVLANFKLQHDSADAMTSGAIIGTGATLGDSDLTTGVRVTEYVHPNASLSDVLSASLQGTPGLPAWVADTTVTLLLQTDAHAWRRDSTAGATWEQAGGGIGQAVIQNGSGAQVLNLSEKIGTSGAWDEYSLTPGYGYTYDSAVQGLITNLAGSTSGHWAVVLRGLREETPDTSSYFTRWNCWEAAVKITYPGS